MPHISRSAAKRLRQAKKRTAINNRAKASINFLAKKVVQAVAAKNKTAAEEAVKLAVQAIDKAVQKKILKKNTAARKKSQLFSKIKAL